MLYLAFTPAFLHASISIERLFILYISCRLPIAPIESGRHLPRVITEFHLLEINPHGYTSHLHCGLSTYTWTRAAPRRHTQFRITIHIATICGADSSIMHYCYHSVGRSADLRQNSHREEAFMGGLDMYRRMGRLPFPAFPVQYLPASPTHFHSIEGQETPSAPVGQANLRHLYLLATKGSP